VILAHTITYAEMAKSKEPVVNAQGIMIDGPDRKMVDEHTKWIQWQKSVQKASEQLRVVPTHVMDYFQATKHLSRPPKDGDVNIMQNGPIDPKLIELPETILTPEPLMSYQPPKNFRLTWSWTALETFRRCPAMWAAKYFYKTVKEAESEAMRWGNIVHAALEHAVLGTATSYELKIITDMDAMKYVDVLNTFKTRGAEVAVEKEMCFDNKMQFSSWKAWDSVWFRGKADVLVVNDNKVTVWDYKTGAVKPELGQLELMCVCAALYYPQAEVFDGRLLFLKHGVIERLPKPILRSELKPILQKVLADVARMQEAANCEVFPARKSGLCRANGKGYAGCANKECPHAK
jgi:hypothetical protein